METVTYSNGNGNGHAAAPGTVVRDRRPPGNYEVEQLPPHSAEAEEAVLGSLMIDEDALYEVADFLKPEAFYRTAHRWIYEAILAIADRHDPLDYLTLCEEMRRRNQLEEVGGEAFLLGLANAVPTSINIEAYGRIVAGLATRRGMIQAASQIARIAFDEDRPLDEAVDAAENALLGVTSGLAADGATPISSVLMDVYDEVLERRERGGELVGIPGGLTDLDKLLRGFKPKRLYLFAGRPGMGKTNFALTVALNMARSSKKRIGFFTLEMGSEELVLRLATMETGIDSRDLEEGKLDDTQWQKFAHAVGQLSQASLWIDDTPSLTTAQLRAKARRLYAEHGLDAVIVDYLQLMDGERPYYDDVARVSHISRSLKKLAMELDVPVIALSQLSRAVEGRKDKRPVLSDLRESGSLEQDADVVVFVYRDEYYNGADSSQPNQAELIIAKHRGGPTGTANAYFQAAKMRFRDLARQELHF
jgi:replicative DNA helicase